MYLSDINDKTQILIKIFVKIRIYIKILKYYMRIYKMIGSGVLGEKILADELNKLKK